MNVHQVPARSSSDDTAENDKSERDESESVTTVAFAFGYGKERLFWAFLAATFIFVAGAVF